MTRGLPETHPLHRLFRGLTETTFLGELGIGDPKLVGYVADLLARFVPSAEVWKIRDASGGRVRQVADMVAEAESAGDVSRRAACHQHVGDFTLFWTGVYPESLGTLRASSSADHLVDFKEQGKRSYFLASTLIDDRAEVFRRLSVEFDLCAFGLSCVRREWERCDAERGPIAPRRIVA